MNPTVEDLKNAIILLTLKNLVLEQQVAQLQAQLAQTSGLTSEPDGDNASA